MPSSTTRRRRGHGEIVEPSSKREKIEALLKVMLETFPQKELTPDEIERWVQDLERFEMQAIEFSFNEHRTLAMFFPVPAQIIELCKTWLAPQKFSPGCDAECKSRHGKGYGESDVLYLMKRYMAKRASLPNRALTEGEVNSLLDDLDKKRGVVPDWRRSA